MLYKHDHLEKKLREHGRAATAEILSIKTEGEGSSFRAMFADDSDLTTTWFNCRLRLRIAPDGEPPFEATVHTRISTIKSAGDTVPVFYDPDDHGQVFVDYLADAHAKMDAVRPAAPGAGDPPRQAEGDLAAQLEALGVHIAPRAGSGSGSHVDELKELADLRDRGVLNDAEFAAEKARILSGS